MKEVIKFAGHKDDLVWIYPKNKLHKDAVIIVDKDYQAIMIRNGEIEIPYLPGKHKVFNNKQSKFSIFNRNQYITNCQIYFFNKSRNIKKREWGTKYPIKYYDKHYETELSLRAHGTYKMYLDNPRLFLNNIQITDHLNYTIENMIKDTINNKLTDVFRKVLILKQYDLLNISVFFKEIINQALELINEELEEFGIKILDLTILQLLPLEEEFNILKETELMTKKEIGELHCPKCNALIKEEMDYCVNCGEKIKEIKDGEENVCLQTIR